MHTHIHTHAHAHTLLNVVLVKAHLLMHELLEEGEGGKMSVLVERQWELSRGWGTEEGV